MITNRIEIGMETNNPPAQNTAKYLLINVLFNILYNPIAIVQSFQFPEMSISFANTKSPHGTRKELMI